MRRAFVLLLVACVAAGGAKADREVSLPGQPAPLAGSLLMPAGDARAPGVVMLGGSGPVDRNGNMPGMLNDSLRKLAEGLAACGVATLRFDKRGVGLSAAAGLEEENLVLDTYVQDARAWAAFLRAQPRIAGVSLLGHGEGAVIATIEAQDGGIDRLILLAAPGRRVSDLLRAQLADIGMAPVLRRRAESAIERLERGETVPVPPPGLATLFRASAQPFLISEFARNPAAELAKTTMPALIVQGTADLQVTVSDAKVLAQARPGATLDVITGMNHVLRVARDDREANLATYTDPELPLAPGLAARLCGFLKR